MEPLIILTGPTAVGKTDLAIKLAYRIGGEIISADSMQVYRGMDIGTAKVKEEEMLGIKHHMINIMEPTAEFNVVIFQKMAKKCIDEVVGRGKIPIITGGTGFYIQALLYDINFQVVDEECNQIKSGNIGSYRHGLEILAKDKGSKHLHNLLAEIDPKAALAIHENNQKRVIRALEYYKQTGNRISEHNEIEKMRKSSYNFVYFVLTDEREKIYANINLRVDRMIADGLINEVKQLQSNGLSRDMISMQGLGYKEIFAYLDGEMSLEEAIFLLKRDTRRFAKRQLTWFRRERDVIWLNKAEFPNNEMIIEKMINILRLEG